MKNLLTIFICLWLAWPAGAATVFVQVRDITSNPVANRTVTVTLVKPTGSSVAGPWVIVGDSLAQRSDASGYSYFSNVLALGDYRMDVAGNPGKSFPFTVADTNGVYNVTSLSGTNPAAPVFYTAAQIDALLAAGGGGAGSATNVVSRPGTNIRITTNVNGADYTYALTNQPAFDGQYVTNVKSGNVSGNVTNLAGNAANLTNLPATSVVGNVTNFAGNGSNVTNLPATSISGSVTNLAGNGSGISNTVPIFAISTNESHVLQFIGTNTVFVSGAGDGANVNTSYGLKGTVGGITVWTNGNGTSGIAFDPSLNVFLFEQNITNGAGVVRYSKSSTTFPASGTWGDFGSGTAPNPTVVVGTNTFSTNITAYYPAGGSFGKVLNTNYYFVNPTIGNDTNAVPGVRERPYQNFTNVIINYAVHTNDVVFLEKGTNYFGYQNIQVSNQVNIVGLSPDRDSYWFAKDASLVDVSDVGIRPGIGSVFANFSGNITIGPFGQANVSCVNLHMIGQVDNFLPTGASNYLAYDCFFEANATDTQSPIDAAVIQGTGSGTVANCIFSVKRRGNGATTRRGLVIKGGTNNIVGCVFIATDSTNNGAFGCIGLSIEGSGFTSVSACSALAYNTNANNAVGFTNALGSGGVVIPSGPLSLIYTNGSVLFVSVHNITVDGNANLLGDSNYVANVIRATDFYGGGANLTALNGSAVASGTVAPARLGSGSGGSTKFLREDSTFQSIPGGGDALTTSPLSQFSATTSSQLRGVLSDESGTGVALFDGAYSTILSVSNLVVGTNSAINPTNALEVYRTNGDIAFSVSDTNGAVTSYFGFAGIGSSLTALNASQLTSGTVPSARLTGDSLTNVTLVANASAVSVITGDGVVRMIAGIAGAMAFPQGLSASQLFATNGAGTATVQADGAAGTVTATSFSGIHIGNGAQLTSIPQSGVTSLATDLSQRITTNDTRVFTLTSGSVSNLVVGTNSAPQTTNAFEVYTTNGAMAFSVSDTSGVAQAYFGITAGGTGPSIFNGGITNLLGFTNTGPIVALDGAGVRLVISNGVIGTMAASTNTGNSQTATLNTTGAASVAGAATFTGNTSGSLSNFWNYNVVGGSGTPTNSGSSVSFDFTKLVALLTTNNAFLTLGVSGKDATGKDMQWATLAVTNSAGLGAAFVTNITFAANTHIIGPTTLNLTNWTELMCEYWPPNGPTNVFVVPCW